MTTSVSNFVLLLSDLWSFKFYLRYILLYCYVECAVLGGDVKRLDSYIIDNAFVCTLNFCDMVDNYNKNGKSKQISIFWPACLSCQDPQVCNLSLKLDKGWIEGLINATVTRQQNCKISCRLRSSFSYAKKATPYCISCCKGWRENGFFPIKCWWNLYHNNLRKVSIGCRTWFLNSCGKNVNLRKNVFIQGRSQ